MCVWLCVCVCVCGWGGSPLVSVCVYGMRRGCHVSYSPSFSCVSSRACIALAPSLHNTSPVTVPFTIFTSTNFTSTIFTSTIPCTVPCTSPIVFEVSPIPARTLQPVARDRKLHHLRLDLPDVPQVDVPADPAHVHVQGALRAGHGRGGLPVQYVADGANGGR